MTLTKFYKEIRSYSEALCSPLNIEDYIPQPEEFVSPPKWHLAHTTWFFEEFVLKEHAEGYQVFHKSFSFLFNSYYNHVGDRTVRTQRGAMTRPTVDQVYKYRQYVDQHMEQLINGGVSTELNDLVVLGLNHEQQHQELLITDLKYTLSLNPLFPVYQENYSLVSDTSTTSEYIKVDAGNYKVGVDASNKGFFYDNEFKRHQVYLESYAIAASLVTNGEYLEFVEDNQYQKFNNWHDEAFAWLTTNKIKKPLYWEKIGDEWYQFTLSGLMKLDPEASLAHISFYEASAYAAWRGMRLPTEQEWEVASDKFSWGVRWEWTQSAYLPYPGFKIAEGAIGEYNGKFMVNQKVLRGASKATSPGHSRFTYRNFFHPHHRWQLTGIRLVK